MPLDEDDHQRLRRIEWELRDLRQLVRDWLALWKAAHQNPAVRIALTINGENMTIAIDSTTSTVTATFEDSHGDATAAPAGNGSGPLVYTFSSDNDSVVTVGSPTDDTSDPGISALLSPVATGTANISVNVTNADGSPLLESDGSTPFPMPSPVSVTVEAGAASQLVLTVNP